MVDICMLGNRRWGRRKPWVKLLFWLYYRILVGVTNIRFGGLELRTGSLELERWKIRRQRQQLGQLEHRKR
jgi:hypothetical protein